MLYLYPFQTNAAHVIPTYQTFSSTLFKFQNCIIKANTDILRCIKPQVTSTNLKKIIFLMKLQVSWDSH